MSENQEKQDDLVSRRNFVKNTGYLVGGAVIGGVLGSSMFPQTKEVITTIEAPPAPVVSEPKQEANYNQALMHFTREQYDLIEAATERIFPEDEHGPGAKLLGVAFFIDHQLAGKWGVNGKEYMVGPFFPGESTQGYQAPMNRQQVFEVGINGLKSHSAQKFNKGFTELTAEEQDEVLKDFQEGNVTLSAITSTFFFNMLRTSTLEGVYADPLYGGNTQMDGWRMKKYPGDQMSYTHLIASENFVLMEPSSLRDHVKGH